MYPMPPPPPPRNDSTVLRRIVYRRFRLSRENSSGLPAGRGRGGGGDETASIYFASFLSGFISRYRRRTDFPLRGCQRSRRAVGAVFLPGRPTLADNPRRTVSYHLYIRRRRAETQISILSENKK